MKLTKFLFFVLFFFSFIFIGCTFPQNDTTPIKRSIKGEDLCTFQKKFATVDEKYVEPPYLISGNTQSIKYSFINNMEVPTTINWRIVVDSYFSDNPVSSGTISLDAATCYKNKCYPSISEEYAMKEIRIDSSKDLTGYTSLSTTLEYVYPVKVTYNISFLLEKTKEGYKVSKIYTCYPSNPLTISKVTILPSSDGKMIYIKIYYNTNLKANQFINCQNLQDCKDMSSVANISFEIIPIYPEDIKISCYENKNSFYFNVNNIYNKVPISCILYLKNKISSIEYFKLQVKAKYNVYNVIYKNIPIYR